MPLSLFLQGSIIGLSMAFPVGPVGMLCIQYSLRRGLMGGVIAGLGAALADAFYGGMAGFGMSLLFHLITSYRLFFQLIGALILLILGITILKSPPTPVDTAKNPVSLMRIFFNTFILTITNPFTLLSFAAIYASFDIMPSDQELISSLVLALGVLMGAAMGWILISVGVRFIERRFPIASTPVFNRVSGGILTGCGCVASLSVVRELLLFL